MKVVYHTTKRFRLNRTQFAATCADPESFVRSGTTWTPFFVFVILGDEGREDPSTTLSGPQ